MDNILLEIDGAPVQFRKESERKCPLNHWEYIQILEGGTPVSSHSVPKNIFNHMASNKKMVFTTGGHRYELTNLSL